MPINKIMRCFIGVDVEEKLKEKIVKIQKNITRAGIKLVERENLHFTLKFLGEIDDEKIEQVKKKLSEVSFKAFKIFIKGVGAFPNINYIRIIWIGCDSPEMNKLSEIVDEKLAGIGFKRNEKYQNHVTIARVRIKPPEKLIKKIRELKDTEIGEMVVDKIKLKESKLTPSGPIYSDLKTFELE